MNRFLPVLTLALLMPALPVQSDTHYVWGGNPSPSNPFTDWSTAATNIQDAVNASTDGDTVLVTNGTYTLTNQISISQGVTVQSVNGAASAIVNGNYPAVTNRCFYLTHTNAVVDGFTITNGLAASSGGGVRMSGGTLQNCTISGNSVTSTWGNGGGVYVTNGTVLNCTVSGNRAQGSSGGGHGLCVSSDGTVSNCLIRDNWGNRYGGVYIDGGTVRNCLIARNQGVSAGGVSMGAGMVQNCLIVSNTSNATGINSGRGGGVYMSGGTLQNCLIVSNTATGTATARGGGVYVTNGTVWIQNCTIVSNKANSYGGGVYNSTNCVVQNTIIYFNSASSGGSNYYNETPGSYSNCCFTPELTNGSTYFSANNITNDPRLVNMAGENYRLSSNSPCRNAGMNQDWMIPPSGTDLDGQPRIRDLNVDIGAYEYIPRGTVFGVRGR